MKYYTRDEAITRMNKLASEGRKFIFVVDYNGEKAIVEEVDKIDREHLLFSFHGVGNDAGVSPSSMDKVEWNVFPPSKEEYKKGFDVVKDSIVSGKSCLVNLTCRVPIETNLSLRDIYLRSQALYKLWIDGMLVCFSPEIFVRINNGEISSYPMKGTIDATLPNAEKNIMDNPKEAAEHAAVVELIKNDIGIVADEVTVKRYRYVDRLSTNKGDILQTSSEICGKLPEDYRERIGNILFSQLPAGSITGAPKNNTVRIIEEAENYERLFYTGVMGIYDNGSLDSSVMIRFIDVENGKTYFKAGGGITDRSELESEYNEVVKKVYVPIS